jgi:hypothetical protein
MLVVVKEEIDDEASLRSRRKKKRGSYMNWFLHDLWPLILEAVTRYCNLSQARNYLRTFYRKPRQPKCPYEILNMTSLSTWFTSEGVLKDSFRDAIEAESANMSSHFYCPLMLERRPELKQEIMSLLKGLREAGQGLSALIVQPIIHGLIEAKAPELLSENAKRGGFKVTIAWTRHFLRYEMDWS